MGQQTHRPVGASPDTDRHDCVICRKPASDGYLTDTRCADRIREALDDIAEYWPEVIDPDGQRARSEGRRAPGFASGVPIDIAAAALLDPTLVWERPGDLRYPPHVLFGWAQHLYTELGYGTWTTVDSAAHYLCKHLSHVTRQPWVAEMWLQVRDTASQLATVVGDIPRRLIGPCPNEVPDASAGTQRCGARLYAPLNGDLITCTRCGDRWTRDQWRRLGGLIQAGRHREAAQEGMVRRSAA